MSCVEEVQEAQTMGQRVEAGAYFNLPVSLL
jgi:hypothetical protein